MGTQEYALITCFTVIRRLRFGAGQTVASCSCLWTVLLHLLLPLAKPSVLPPLGVSNGGCCCSCDTARGPPGIAFTPEQSGVAGPAPGNLCTVGTGLSSQQDRR